MKLRCEQGKMDVVLVVGNDGTPYIFPYDLDYGTRKIHEVVGGKQTYTSRSGASGEGWVPNSWRVRKLNTYCVDTSGLIGLPREDDIKVEKYEREVGFKNIYIPVNLRKRKLATEWPLVVLYKEGVFLKVEMVADEPDYSWADWITEGMRKFDGETTISLTLVNRWDGFHYTRKTDVTTRGRVNKRLAKLVLLQIIPGPEHRIYEANMRGFWGEFGVEIAGRFAFIRGPGDVISEVIYTSDLEKDPEKFLGPFRPYIKWISPEMLIVFPPPWENRMDRPAVLLRRGENESIVRLGNNQVYSVARMIDSGNQVCVDFAKYCTGRLVAADEFIQDKELAVEKFGRKQKSDVDWGIDLYFGADEHYCFLKELVDYLMKRNKVH